MSKLLVLYFISMVYAQSLCARLPNKIIHDSKSGTLAKQTSYVSPLSFDLEKTSFMVDGCGRKHSHKVEWSHDFNMKRGSKVFAARQCPVTDVKHGSAESGVKDENLEEGNLIARTTYAMVKFIEASINN